MKNKNISNKTKNIFLCVIVFVVYLYMAYCVPYMDDDWLNGGADGWYIAMSGITNGRYFGNFIICILVRNKIVKVLVMSIVIWSISFIISYYGFNIKTSIFGYKFLVINILLMLINESSILNESALSSTEYPSEATSEIILQEKIIIVPIIFPIKIRKCFNLLILNFNE